MEKQRLGKLGFLAVAKPIKWSWATLINTWPRSAHSTCHAHSQSPPRHLEGLDSIPTPPEKWTGSSTISNKSPQKEGLTNKRKHSWKDSCLRAPYWTAVKASRILFPLSCEHAYHWMWEDSRIFLEKRISVKKKKNRLSPFIACLKVLLKDKLTEGKIIFYLHISVLSYPRDTQ